MFSPKIKYFLYGSLVSASLITFATQAATGPDGVFGDYFKNIVTDATTCGSNYAITGFKTTSGHFGEQECSTFQDIVKSVLGVGSAPTGQALIGVSSTGSAIYGDVNWHRDSLNDISYIGGRVGIGTQFPSQSLDVQGDTRIANDLNVVGNVGIGTATPTTKLDIRGSAANQATVSVTAKDGSSVATGWPVGWGGGIQTWDILASSAKLNGGLQVLNNVDVAQNVNVGQNINVNGNINTTGDVCTTQGGKTICLDAQKGDPIYLRGIDDYTGKYPSNAHATGIVGKGIKQEWDEYGRAGCQSVGNDLSWTLTEISNCQSQYPGDGRSLQDMINGIPNVHQLVILDYQIRGGNTWVPKNCDMVTMTYICDGWTQCGNVPSGTNNANPDWLEIKCFGR